MLKKVSALAAGLLVGGATIALAQADVVKETLYAAHGLGMQVHFEPVAAERYEVVANYLSHPRNRRSLYNCRSWL